MEIKNAQDAVKELMLRSDFNNFVSSDVIKLLENYPKAWSGFVWGRFDGHAELISLRDINSGSYNADTLMILPNKGAEQNLELIANGMGADEVSWIGGKEACNLLGSWSSELETNARAILRVWWD